MVRELSGGFGLGENEGEQPPTPRSAVLLEKFFMTGLQYLSQGVGLLTKLREKLGNNSSAAKTMIGMAMDQLRLALGEFNVYLERQSEVFRDEENTGHEMEQIKRLLAEYRDELDNVKAKNRELRDLLALKMDGKDRSRDYHDDEYDNEINQQASKTRVKRGHENFLTTTREADWGQGRVDQVTFGKNKSPSRVPIPDEMLKSSHNIPRPIPNDDAAQERHNRSYVSINLDKGFESHFGKKVKPHVFGSHSKKTPSQGHNFNNEAFKHSQSNMKTSVYLGHLSDHMGTLKSGQSLVHPQKLEEEISQLDAKILSLMSEMYDEFNVDLRKPGSPH